MKYGLSYALSTRAEQETVFIEFLSEWMNCELDVVNDITRGSCHRDLLMDDCLVCRKPH